MYTTGRKVQGHVKCTRFVIGIPLYARNSLLDLKLCRDGDCNFARALEVGLPPWKRMSKIGIEKQQRGLAGDLFFKKKLSLRR
jgi:hypothetical protein